MNGKQLRNSILQWAISGRLVPQDPNDEPAIELLKRINPKFTPQQTDEPLPPGWTACRLGDVLNIMMGQSPSGSSINSVKGVEFHQGKIAFTDKYLEHSNKFTTEPVRIAEPNSLLICVRAPVGDVNISERKICIGRGLCAATPKVGNITFYFYLLQTLKQGFESKATGSTFKAISKNIVEEETIPLPPLAEQERIVKEVERWFACIEQMERSREALGKAARQTKRTLLSLAISGRLVPQDPNDEPAIELLKRINSKFTPLPTDSPLPPGWTACGYKDIFSNIASKPYQILQSQIKETGKTPVISQSASYIEGYSNEDCLLQHDEPLIVFGDHTKVVKYVDFDFIVGADGVKIIEPLINRKYAFYLLLYASTHIYNRGYARHFSLISKFVFPLPPLAEQERIVGKVEELFAVLDALQ